MHCHRMSQSIAIRAARVSMQTHSILTTSSHAFRVSKKGHGRDLSGALAGVPLHASRQLVIQEAASHPERCRQHLRRARRHGHRPAHGCRQTLRQAPQPEVHHMPPQAKLWQNPLQVFVGAA